MRWKKTLFLLTLFALLCVSVPSYAQDYRFSLDKEEVDVWINQDGSVRLEYSFTFTCDTGNYHIAAVDVGLPTGDYDLSDIHAYVGDTPVRITSDYWGDGSYGVAAELDGQTIRSGETATVRVIVERVGGMIYPRWHQSPSGWPQAEPDAAIDEQGRVVYTWYNASAAPDRQYMFGASYPSRYVSASAIQKGPSAIEQIFGAITGALSCCCNPIWLFVAFFGGIIGLSVWGNRKRKMQYLPPSMKVEGVGIKRGLTAVESALLLETPLNKVMTMILFGLLKKGAVTVLDDDPLKVEANEPLPKELRSYEKKFLETIKKDKTLSESRLRKMMVALVKEVGNKMKGFSRKETVTYYKDIVRRAWQQIEAAETPEVRSQRFDEGLEWTMMDDKFDDRVEHTFRRGPVYVPMWWGYYRPWATHTRPTTTARPSTSSRPSTGRVQLPTLPGAAFAATIVSGVQSTSSRIIRNITGFTSGVTQTTNPPPKPSSSGRYSGGGGGSSCACACACAGCACACAGGGR
jgi:hypothetical protein